LGSRSIIEVFTNINDFLDANPNEVLLINLELNSEADDVVDVNQFYEILQAVPGFVDKMYEHASLVAEWPTLRQAIDTRKVSAALPTVEGIQRNVNNHRLTHTHSLSLSPNSVCYFSITAVQSVFSLAMQTLARQECTTGSSLLPRRHSALK
jgi:hypothetical protein